MDFNSLSAIASPALSGIAGLFQTQMQNDFNRQMIREQNEYNSPKQQMLRFAEAGLSPNLIYGQMSNPNQTQPVQKSAPDFTGMANTAMRAVNNRLDIKRRNLALLNQEQEIKQREQDIAVKNAMEDAIRTKTIGQTSQNMLLLLRGQMGQYQFDNYMKTHLANLLKIDESQIDKLMQSVSNLKRDYDIKGNIIQEGNYYRNSREAFGVDRNSPWYVKPITGFFNYFADDQAESLYDKAKRIGKSVYSKFKPKQ